MNPDQECQFCRIRTPERIFYEDGNIVGLLAKDAIAPGQSLVIPRKHFEDLSDLPYDTTCRIFDFCRVLSKIMTRVFQANGVNIVCNNGKYAGQEVRHLHVHVIPRFKGDVPNPRLWLNRELFDRLYQPTADDLREMALKMRASITSFGDHDEKQS